MNASDPRRTAYIQILKEETEHANRDELTRI